MIKNLNEYPAKLIETLNLLSFLPTDVSALKIVLPGDVITTDQGFMQYTFSAYKRIIPLKSGHGTYEKDGVIYSSLMGTIEKTDKLLLVNPLRMKYQAEVGDVIIGRVLEIANKKWIIDINSNTEAALNLNSTYLPEQRKKTEEDELNMRNIFKENDLITAEVHSLNNDRTTNLHTRSLKYGKLENGILVSVHNKLLRRQKHHFVRLECGIFLILAHNGNVWISEMENNQANDSEKEKETIITNSVETREKMAKIRNILKLLNFESIEITIDLINEIYELCRKNNILAKDLLFREKQSQILTHCRKKIEEKIPKELNKLTKQGDFIIFE